MPDSDALTFDGGSDVAIRLGINRQLGGIATSLKLINLKAKDQPLQITDARSAGGAAMQASLGLVQQLPSCTDPKTCFPATAFNQSAGNSALNWGFEADWLIGPQIAGSGGMVQKQWTPIFSNDSHTGTGTNVVTLQSPCYHTGSRFGNGRASYTATYPTVAGSAMLSLDSSYFFRAIGDQGPISPGTAEANYILREAARLGKLQIYSFHQNGPKDWKGQGDSGPHLLGPITPFENFVTLPYTAQDSQPKDFSVQQVRCATNINTPVCNLYDTTQTVPMPTPRAVVKPQYFSEMGLNTNQVAFFSCNADPAVPCFLQTQAADYIVMVWRVAGTDFAMAIHGTLDSDDPASPISLTQINALVMLKQMSLCATKTFPIADRCGDVVFWTMFNLPAGYTLHNLRTLRQHVHYEVGTLDQISALLNYKIPTRAP